MSSSSPEQRFSNRVENYIRYRPSYPPQVLETLRVECGLTPDSTVADIASGTGIFSRLLLENGNRVYGVEPNRDMREAAERSEGRVELQAGALYRLLARLLDDGLVVESQRRPAADADDERRRYYRLTPLGRRIATAEADRLWRLLAIAKQHRLLTRA